MPSARRGMSLGLVGNRLFAIAGFDGLAQTVNEEAVLDSLPTVTAGGPYTGPGGGTVQLAASGNDPDGDSLAFAWGLDGDLVYETPGENPLATVPRKPNGTYPVRVRALDPKGGYAVAVAQLTITCSPRPPVSVQTVRLGPGQIRTTITAGSGQVGLLRLGQPRPLAIAIVNVQGGPQNVTTSTDVTVAATQVVFSTTRQPGRGQVPVTVPFQLIDACTPSLPWTSFVGFGSGI